MKWKCDCISIYSEKNCMESASRT